MNAKNDGGPAFPQNDAAVNRINNEAGMSLRDYFAAKAMQQILDTNSFDQGESSLRIDAARCWRFADAMLAERAR